MDWKCGSSGRKPALQAQTSEFKPQSHPKKGKERKEEERNTKGSNK
jgi:hypothetical protein